MASAIQIILFILSCAISLIIGLFVIGIENVVLFWIYVGVLAVLSFILLWKSPRDYYYRPTELGEKIDSIAGGILLANVSMFMLIALYSLTLSRQ